MDPHPRARLVAALARGAAAAWLLPVRHRGEPGQGSLLKCVDASGNITYQDSLCTPGQAGRAIELPKAEAREDTCAWEAAARDARVIAGMPKRWVLRSRGAPIEIRPASAREDATEIWRYPVKDGALLVGFAGSNVAWVREDTPFARPAAAPAPPPARNVATTRGAQNRRFVIAGRFCEHVFAEIGAADREEPVLAADRRAAMPTGRQALRTTSRRPAILRCAPCSAASAARSPTSSGPWCMREARCCRSCRVTWCASACACRSLIDGVVLHRLPRWLGHGGVGGLHRVVGLGLQVGDVLFHAVLPCVHILVPAPHPLVGRQAARMRIGFRALVAAAGDCASAAPVAVDANSNATKVRGTDMMKLLLMGWTAPF